MSLRDFGCKGWPMPQLYSKLECLCDKRTNLLVNIRSHPLTLLAPHLQTTTFAELAGKSLGKGASGIDTKIKAEDVEGKLVVKSTDKAEFLKTVEVCLKLKNLKRKKKNVRKCEDIIVRNTALTGLNLLVDADESETFFKSTTKVDEKNASSDFKLEVSAKENGKNRVKVGKKN